MIVYEYETLRGKNDFPELKIVKKIKTKDINFSVNNIQIVNFMNKYYGMNRKYVEYVYLLTIDGKNRIRNIIRISQGDWNQSLIPKKEIFSNLLLLKANRYLLIHNHPDSSAKPSDSDIEITGKLVEGSKLLGLDFVDHIIIYKNGYFSFLENE